MAKTKVKSTLTEGSTPKRRRALSPKAREAQLVSMAYDYAEDQMNNGTASSQIVTHFLKLGGEKEKLERAKLEEENKLLKAKTEALESSKLSEELYEKVITAMKSYQGQPVGMEAEEEEYYD